MSICWCSSGDSLLNHSTQRLWEVSQPWHSTWTAARPQLAADGETLRQHTVSYFLKCIFKAPCYLVLVQKRQFYTATDELYCSFLPNNVALYLNFSFPAALPSLPVTNRPLGGNISPAASTLVLLVGSSPLWCHPASCSHPVCLWMFTCTHYAFGYDLGILEQCELRHQGRRLEVSNIYIYCSISKSCSQVSLAHNVISHRHLISAKSWTFLSEINLIKCSS